MAIPKPQRERDIILRELSDLVSCQNDYRKDALKLTENVRDLMSTTIKKSYGLKAKSKLQKLRPEFKFSVKECIIGGSFEKRTEVLAPDVDVVFRLNGVMPPDEKFPVVLDYFVDFLRTATQLSIIPGSIKRTNYSVGFTSYNGIEFDLLPATSITDPEEVYRMMREDKNNARYYRSSLAEKQKQFMKEQSSFAKSVARLGKLWLKLIYFDQHASAGGTFIELISVAASMITREETGTESCFRGFWKTLEMIRDHRKLQLTFVREAGVGGNWSIARRGWWQWILAGNYVMDPSDPAENLLQNDRLKQAMGDLRKAACASIEKLKEWNKGDKTLMELFEPYPLKVQWSLVDDGGIQPEIIYLSHTKYGENYVEVDVTNPKVLNFRELRKVLEVLKIRVHSLLVCNAQERRRDGGRLNLVDFVEENILEWLPEANVITYQGTNLKTFDVTMSFGSGDGWALRVSVKWPNEFHN